MHHDNYILIALTELQVVPLNTMIDYEGAFSNVDKIKTLY